LDVSGVDELGVPSLGVLSLGVGDGSGGVDILMGWCRVG
jgi:hypothetical protein